MSRKTPPVAEQVIGPYIYTNAFLKARLIDFDTGKSELESQHKLWLANKTSYAKLQSDYRVWLIGYASKIGDTAFNQNLSNDRMNAVLKYMGTVDSQALSKVATWVSRGSAGYTAAASDNSADERAVEVHIFIGSDPPDGPPPDATPVSHSLPPLPGGTRYSKWSVAAPGGASFTIPPAEVVGGNIILFRNRETGEERKYFSPEGGVGISVNLPGGKLATLLTAPSFSAVSFTDFTTDLPVTWDELEDSLVTISSVGVGIPNLGPVKTGTPARRLWGLATPSLTSRSARPTCTGMNQRARRSGRNWRFSILFRAAGAFRLAPELPLWPVL